MIEEAARLETYLPVSYRTPKERDYVRFLWEAFDTNVEYGSLRSEPRPCPSFAAFPAPSISCPASPQETPRISKGL